MQQMNIVALLGNYMCSFEGCLLNTRLNSVYAFLFHVYMCMCMLLVFRGFLLLVDAQALLKLNIFTIYLDASDVKVMSEKACRQPD